MSMVSSTWSWAALTLLFLFVEGALAGSFVAVFFAAGATVAALGCAAGLLPMVWQQCAAFAVVATASAALAREPLLQWARASARAHPVEPLTGSDARVTRPMAPGATGEVSLHGAKWSARNHSPHPLHIDDVCRVQAHEGLMLQVIAHQKEVK